MKLYHYSKVDGLTELRPEHHGSGLKGAELKRKLAFPDLYLDRCYLGTESYRKEPGLGHCAYVADLPDYAIATQADFESAWQLARSECQSPSEVHSRFELALYREGFTGYRVGEVVVSFEPVTVAQLAS